jgi:hypothetical protein
VLAIAGIVLGIILGYAAGGRIGGIPEIDARVWVSLMVLSVAQGLARGRGFGTTPTPAGLVVWGVASLVVCVAAAIFFGKGGAETPGLRGLVLVILGTLLNVLIVLLNQGMPAVGVDGAAAQIGASGGFYVQLNEGTFLPWLGDVLVMDIGPSGALLSIGDVLLLAGAAIVIIELMLVGRGPDSTAFDT